MTGGELAVGVVFLAGLGSFFSPCVFPIVPAYLSLISGLSFEELTEASAVRQARWKLFASAAAFVVGFSLITIGLMGGLVAAMANMDHVWLSRFRVAGAIVVFILAFHMIGVFRITALFRERRFHVTPRKAGVLGAVLVGAAFAFGWTPCIAPTLGGVLGLSAGTAKTGLLVTYTAGLAIPFLLAAVFVDLFVASMKKVTRHLRKVEIASGILLLAMGVLLITDKLNLLQR